MDTTRYLDTRAAAVVERLHTLSSRQLRLSFIFSYLFGSLRNRLQGDGLEFTQTSRGRKLLSDKLVALDPEKAALCYLLCRSLNARRVVEAGTSYGVSTIYLACAVRDNTGPAGEPGMVIGTEHEPAKAAAARRHFEEAGVAGFIDLREGDLRVTLKEIDGPVDFLLVDIWIPMARPALDLVAPKLRPGAIVLCDNVSRYEREYADYLSLVRNPQNGFRSLTLPMSGGLELSVRLA
jgi:predicted O-methyltransferase YrrM